MGTYVIGEMEVVNEVSLAPSAALYDGAVSADGDLTFKVNAFYYDIGGLHGKYPGSVGNFASDNATNYVYLDDAGNLGSSTTGYPEQAHIRLARVVAMGGIIVRVILERAFFTAGTTLSSQTAKSGVVVPGDFTGNPKTRTVVFDHPYPNTDYAVTLSVNTDGSKSFAAAVENKTATGFVINLHSNNVANLIEIGWHTMRNGS